MFHDSSRIVHLSLSASLSGCWEPVALVEYQQFQGLDDWHCIV
jgi:hypothetical protein